MLWFALVMFAVAAVGGVIMAVSHFRGNNPAVPLAATHGALAATGVGVLIAAAMAVGATPLLLASLGLFGLAAIGGLTLVSFHFRRRTLPDFLVIAHGGAAVIGFVLLLLAIVRGAGGV